MHRHWFTSRMRATLAAAALLTCSGAVVGSAHAQEGAPLECPGKQQLVRIDEKICPPNPKRPAIVIKRRCCLNPGDKVVCLPFLPCPPRSPS